MKNGENTDPSRACHIWPGVRPKSEDPELAKLDDDPIYKKVFGAMEQLRIEESLRCRERIGEFYHISPRGYKSHPRKFGKGKGNMSCPHLDAKNRKEIGELSFSTLTGWFYDAHHGYNFAFPIDTSLYLPRRSP